MLKTANRTDIIWGYAAQLLNVGSGIFLLPFTLRYLHSEELGLWYVFVALAGLAQLLEFGFQPTIGRQTAYIYSGLQDLSPFGLPSGEKGELNLTLLADLVAASRRIYGMVAAGAAAILFGAGSYYVYTLLNHSTSTPLFMSSWLIYAASALINFYFGYFNGLLQGRGEQTTANKTVAISRGVLVGLSIPLLISGFGLMGLAVASLISSIISRIFMQNMYYSHSRPETVFLKANRGNAKILSVLLWKSAWRLGVVQLGSFMILRANLFFATSFLGLTAAASYGLSLQIMNLLVTMAGILFSLQMPKMNALQADNNSNDLRDLFSSSVVASWVIYTIGAVFVICAGPHLLHALQSKTLLLEAPWLIALAVILVLEMNHSLSAMYLTTLNYVPFVLAALISGFSIVVLGPGLMHLTHLGIGALILAQGGVQLAYNNWKWPAVAFDHLQLNRTSFFKHGKNGLLHILNPA